MIIANQLVGTGTIAANGGNPIYPTAGGGGGGRVAVLVTDATDFTGSLQAYGGGGIDGSYTGSAGTVYYKTAISDQLIISNPSLSLHMTYIGDDTNSFSTVTVENFGELAIDIPDSYFTFAELRSTSALGIVHIAPSASNVILNATSVSGCAIIVYQNGHLILTNDPNFTTKRGMGIGLDVYLFLHCLLRSAHL